jgi:hypothetical protein
MPGSPQQFARLAVLLAETTDPETIDRLLDQWLDYGRLATEFDVEKWGFPPGWCSKERRELMRRARHSTGVVPLDDALGTTEGTAA